MTLPVSRSKTSLDIFQSLQKAIADLSIRVDALARNLSLPDWINVGDPNAPAFQNSWVPYGAPFAAPAFWRNASGMVCLRGLAKNGTIGTTIFTLPIGFRPAAQLLFANYAGGAIGRLDVGSDGTVQAVSGSNAYFQLDGITFRAEI